MKREELFNGLKKVLGNEDLEIIETTDLKSLDEYDSLTIIPLLAFIHTNFNKTFTAAQIYSVKTVQNLMDLIGLENFE